jgi:hypothetical protein
MTAAIIARDHSRLKMKHCLVGGFDRAWHQASAAAIFSIFF